MITFIVKRVLWMIPIILGVSFFIMLILEVSPGDPAHIILGIDATEESVRELNEELGLDKPFLVRYVRFLWNAVAKGDLGISFTTREPVIKQIAFRIPYTFIISVFSLLISIVIGIPVGVFAATKHNSIGDNLTMFGSLVFVSMPDFWFALLMVSVFAFKLKLLPSLGVETWKGYIIPCIAVSLSTMANIARQTRSSMLEVIRADFVTTAYAKGQKKRRVIYGHALENAMLPIITVIGSRFANALAGTMVVEAIFSIPGMGNYLVTAITSRDYAVVQAGTLVVAIWFGLCILLMDILYALIDPRMRGSLARITSK